MVDDKNIKVEVTGLVQRKTFENELDHLHNEILLMASIVEDMMRDSIDSLANRDKNLAIGVIERDDMVDDKEIAIQELCVLLIATQQPVASDVRRVTSAFKIISNLERIGDNAVNIANITTDLIDKKVNLKEISEIKRMSDVVIELVRKCIDSYINLDISEVDEILALEEEVDNIYHNLRKDLVQRMISDASMIEQYSKFIFVSSHLERVGDHGINIFESVNYMVTGEYKDF